MPHPPLPRQLEASVGSDDHDVPFTARTDGHATARSGMEVGPAVSLPYLARWEQVQLRRRRAELCVPDAGSGSSSGGQGSSDSSSSRSSQSEESDDELDAMDPETYRMIHWHRRRLEQTPMSSYSSGSDLDLPSDFDGEPYEKYTKWELQLRQDFAKNKLCWYGDFKKDLWVFVANTNPILSLCYSHPLHPISLWDRLVAYLVDAIFILLLSCAIMEAHGCFACGITTCESQGLSNTSWVQLPKEHWVELANASQTQENFHARIKACTRWMRYTETGFVKDTQQRRPFQMMPPRYTGPINTSSLNETTLLMREFRVGYNWCCACNRLGITWWVEHEMELLFLVIANSAFILLIFQVIICCCVQTKSHRTRKYGERAGYTLLGLVTIVLALLAPPVFWYMRMHNALRQMLIQLVSGKCLSWTVVSVWQVLLFGFLWRMQLSGSGLLDARQDDASSAQAQRAGGVSVRSAATRMKASRRCCAGPRGFLFNTTAAEFADLVAHREMERQEALTELRRISEVTEACGEESPAESPENNKLFSQRV